MRPLGNHVQAAILRGVTDVMGAADREKPTLVIEEVRSREWASATFVGAVHEFDLRIEGDADAVASAVAVLCDCLPEQEIAITGHIVAELAVIPGAQHIITANMITKTLTVNALTVID